jgi:c-di-GMP-binding flagellar brake protein YcgR
MMIPLAGRFCHGFFRDVMNDRDIDILTQAIERNSAAVLALPSAGMVRYYKSRFLRAVDERVWLEGVPTEGLLIDTLIQEATPVEVAFKSGQRKVTFTSPIFEVDGEYRFFDAQSGIQAVLMQRPAAVKPLQRRTYYRVPVREDDEFSIQLWRMAEHLHLKDEPKDLCYLPATVRDLSVGGVGVIFQAKPLLVTGQRMRILLKQEGREPMLMEGRAGTVRQDNQGGTFETGIEFRGLQNSLQGRQTITDLTRIVSRLQLNEAKRIRSLAG